MDKRTRYSPEVRERAVRHLTSCGAFALAHQWRVVPPYGGPRYYAGFDLHRRYFTLCLLTCTERQMTGQQPEKLNRCHGPVPVVSWSCRSQPVYQGGTMSTREKLIQACVSMLAWPTSSITSAGPVRRQGYWT